VDLRADELRPHGAVLTKPLPRLPADRVVELVDIISTECGGQLCTALIQIACPRRKGT
jgi:hypothetical protein